MMDKRYQAVLFDLDGTLLNTLEDLADAVNFVKRKYHQPEHSIEEVRSFVGNGIRKLMIRSIEGGEKNPLFEEEFMEFQRFYLSHDKVKTVPYDGISELLLTCRKKHIKMGIVSNKYQAAVEDLRQFYFADTIDTAIGDSKERKRKPAPDGPLIAAQSLGVPIHECLYVGDSDVDAQTAENAGMDCILVSWGFRDKSLLEKLDVLAVVDTPQELQAYLI